MNFKNLDCKEYIYQDTLKTCREIGETIKHTLHTLYDEQKIVGYSIQIIESSEEAHEEDIDIEDGVPFPFIWMNITYNSSNFDPQIALSLRERFKLCEY